MFKRQSHTRKDNVFPVRNKRITVCLVIEYSLYLQVHPIQKKFVRQQSFKKLTLPTDHAETPKAAGNSLFGTVKWPLCIFFRCPLFGNFHMKEIYISDAVFPIGCSNYPGNHKIA